jgi:uncharacterized iron-regulated protein
MKIHHVGLLFFCFTFACDAGQVVACDKGKGWWSPVTQAPVAETNVVDSLSKDTIVLIGEHHANAEHHHWHIALLKTLQARYPQIVLGLEIFPRRTQTLLDRWIAGDMSEDEFIQAIDWQRIWGYDIELYLPLLRYAREHHVPLIALNVDRELIQNIRERGLSKVGENEREGVSVPAKPSRAYVTQLAASFREHGVQYDSKEAAQMAFLRFVEQQTFWDRAMSEALLTTKSKHPEKMVIGIVGSWHLIHKQGVPYQMESQMKTAAKTLIPWDDNLDCNDLNTTFADFVFFLGH